jgi:hypothetical protein
MIADIDPDVGLEGRPKVGLEMGLGRRLVAKDHVWSTIAGKMWAQGNAERIADAGVVLMQVMLEGQKNQFGLYAFQHLQRRSVDLVLRQGVEEGAG